VFGRRFNILTLREVFDFQCVFFDQLVAGSDVVANEDAEAEICDNKFVDSGQQVCGK